MGIHPTKIMNALVNCLVPTALDKVKKDKYDIIHEKKGTRFKEKSTRALQMAILVTQIAIQALVHLRDGRLKMSDALVGEQSCQIRASHIVTLAAHLSSSQLAQKTLKETIECLVEIQKRLLDIHENPLKMPKLPEDIPLAVASLLQKLVPEEVKEVENPQGEDLKEEDIIYTVLSHALCLTRDAKEFKETNGENLREFLVDKDEELFTKVELLEVVYKAKYELADRSAKVVQAQAHSLNNKVLKAFSKNCVENIGSKYKAIPCFHSIHITLEHVKRRKHPIILSIGHKKQIKVTLCAEDGENLKVMPKGSLHPSTAAYVIEGESESPKEEADLLEELLGGNPSERLMEICLANAAAHPQYVENLPIKLFNKKMPIDKSVKEKSFPIILQKVEKTCLAHPEETIGNCIRLTLEEINKNKPLGEIDVQYKHLVPICSPLSPEELCGEYVRMAKLKRKAHAEGLCGENKSLFSIKHIYPSTLGEELGLKMAEEEKK